MISKYFWLVLSVYFGKWRAIKLICVVYLDLSSAKKKEFLRCILLCMILKNIDPSSYYSYTHEKNLDEQFFQLKQITVNDVYATTLLIYDMFIPFANAKFHSWQKESNSSDLILITWNYDCNDRNIQQYFDVKLYRFMFYRNKCTS